MNQEIKGWRITAIRNSSGTERLDFFYQNNREDIDPFLSTTPKSLDKIEYSTGTFCTAYDFHYSYFESPGGTASYYKRLKLDSLQHRSCDLTESIPVWAFEYYGGTIQHRLSRQIDHWGYQNSAAINEGTFGIPNLANETYDIDFDFPPIDTAWRETNEAAMKIGNLKTIFWPDGGSSHFEYEANEVTTSVTGGSTYQAILFPDLSNCGIPIIDNNCCSVFSKTLSHTFTTAELDGAVFGIYVYDATCNVGNRDYPTVQIFVKETSAAGYGAFNSFSFDTDYYCGGQGGICDIENIPLTTLELSTPFTAGVSYTFELILDNQASPGDEDVKATFQIFNETPGNISLVDREVGGLRVTKITDKDGLSSATDQIRTFDYTNSNGYSSGRLAFEPTYYGYQKDVFGEKLGLTFHSTSFVPTANSTGNHISYAFVAESFNNNGKNFSFFHQEQVVESYLDEYPYSPDLARVIDGQEITAKVFDNDDNLLVENINTPLINYIYTNPSEDIIYKGIQYQNKDGDTGHYAKKYRLRTAPSGLITKSISTRDGVRTETNSTYDITKHLSPISSSIMDDRGIPYTTELSYIFDDISVFGFDLPLFTIMEDQNRIATPIQTVEKNNGIAVKGRRTQYAYFDETTGSPSGALNSIIYPSAFYDFEMTFDAAGVAQMNGNGWELDGVIAAYDPKTGKAANYQKLGWQQETYTWNEITKLIEQRKFIDFEWDYTFYTDTKLIESITDIDGQIVNFYYDSMMRIQRISVRGGAVETEFSYVYAGAGNTYIERKTTYAADPSGNSELQETRSRQYFDGLGRAILEIQIGHSENGKDVVTAIEYNDNGRPHKQYEPIESPHSDGRFYEVHQDSAHTLTEYETSPLNRVKQVTAPDWHPSQQEYGANTVADAVKDYSTSGTYAAGTLFKNTSIDGNGNKKVVFSDFRGKVIIERTESADGLQKNDLYRNFDLKEREKAIYPPGTSPDSTGLIFTKLYDEADNLIEKKVPDAEKMEMVYDARELLIAKRGGKLRADGKWMVTERDDYGRTKQTGLNTTPTIVNEVWSKTFWDGEVEVGGGFTGFTPLQAPKDFLKELQDILDAENANVVPIDNSSNPIYKGKVHYTETAILTGNTASVNRLFSINRYETHGRLDRVETDNHLGGFDNVFLYYDFADNQTKEIRFHSQLDDATDFVTQTRDYFDHQGRKNRNTHLLTGIGLINKEICSLEYDAKDLLKTKKLGGNGSGGFLQEINYDYLDNGFLKGINSIMSADDLFQLNINYDQAIAGLSGVAQKNGNISQLRWKVKGGMEQTYGYVYDFKDQLTQAKFGTYSGVTLSITDEYSSTYGYDTRGNILNITRNGMYDTGSVFEDAQIDNMSLGYYSGTNKLKTATDAAPCPDKKVIHQALDNTELHAVGQTIEADNLVNETADIIYQAGTSVTLKAGFHAKAGTNFVAKIDNCPSGNYETGGFVQRSTNDYLWDENGNQTRDPHKEIDIDYNYLNLPYQITFDNGNVIEWLYGAGGTKLHKKTISNAVVGLTLDYLGGNFEYLNDTLDAIYLADAKLVLDKGTPKEYQYYLRDNVGNNRLVFRDSLGIPTIVNESHYYPNGGLMVGSWKRNSKAKFLYNGIESVGDFGLNVYHAKYRTLDQWTGRWWQIDSEVEQFYSLTPYNSNFNNPVRFSDPDGDCPWCVGAIVGAAIDYGSQVAVNYATGNENPWTDVDTKSIAISAGAGATGVGLVSAVNKGARLLNASKTVTKAVTVVGEATVDATVNAAQQYANNSNLH